MKPTTILTKNLISISLLTSSFTQACSVSSSVKITFFGFPDNDPPSNQIAHDCGRGFTAGGTGTFDDPVTFAAASNGPLSVCDVVYIPYLRKYGRYEDLCGQCTKDWTNEGLLHIDVWTGDNSNGGSAQINCENNLTRDPKVILLNPGAQLQADPTPLFFSDSGTCTTHKFVDGDTDALCASSGDEALEKRAVGGFRIRGGARA